MKRLFLLLFCVCALWLFALFAFAEEAPALAQVEHVTSTLSDDTVVTLQWEAVEDATGYKVTLYNEEMVVWEIIANFTAFGLWQIGYTHYERTEGYEELLLVHIAKYSKLCFIEKQ